MNRFKRYCSALHRYKRSKGYGVHSPFAFNFILRVLRERYPYYAYENIHRRRIKAKKLATKTARHPRIISYNNAKMLFRITCYFSPDAIFQIGTSCGISTTSMLDVSSNTKLVIYPVANTNDDVYHNITESYASRIFSFHSLEQSIAHYKEINAGKPHFVLINGPIDNEKVSLLPLIQETLLNNGTIIMRNLSRTQSIRNLWNKTCDMMQFGMSFSNERIGVIVSYKHLPLQHFSLWL